LKKSCIHKGQVKGFKIKDRGGISSSNYDYFCGSFLTTQFYYSMKVGKDKVVTLTYELRLKDEEGEVIQKVEDNRPFVHLFGAGTLLPSFENNLDGLVPGDEFGFHLTAEEAYGDLSNEAIVELDREIFEIDGQLDEEIVAVGKMVAMQDEQGRPLEGTVLDIKDESIIMDFNHPLAGESLYFSGKIKDVREASKDELAHGHVHGEGGHQH
jgi:FKBP-type peptidyl-prolyl cis-trans isomerase SlyD